MCDWCKDYDEAHEANSNRDVECPNRPVLYNPNTEWSTDFGLVMRGPSDFGEPIYDEYAQWVEHKEEGGWKNWLKKLRQRLM